MSVEGRFSCVLGENYPPERERKKAGEKWNIFLPAEGDRDVMYHQSARICPQLYHNSPRVCGDKMGTIPGKASPKTP